MTPEHSQMKVARRWFLITHTLKRKRLGMYSGVPSLSLLSHFLCNLSRCSFLFSYFLHFAMVRRPVTLQRRAISGLDVAQPP